MNRRLDIEVGVAYGSDPAQVVALLKRVIAATPDVAQHPEPTVLFLRLGASSLDFSVRACTHDFSNWANVRSDLMTRIYAALNEAGIEIPFPQQDLHLRSVSEQAAAMLATQRPTADES